MPSDKYCIVPKCKNTSVNAPNKLFLTVPKDAIVRKKWCKAMRRDDKTPLSSQSGLYCCEDHFDLETDMENHLKYKLVGGKLILKKGVTPHKFACQKAEDKKPVESPGYEKRQQIEYNQRVLNPDICHENLIPQVEFVSCESADLDSIIDGEPIRDNVSDTLDRPNHKSVAVQVNVRTKGKYQNKATNTDAKIYNVSKFKKNKKKLVRKPLLDESTVP